MRSPQQVAPGRASKQETDPHGRHQKQIKTVWEFRQRLRIKLSAFQKKTAYDILFKFRGGGMRLMPFLLTSMVILVESRQASRLVTHLHVLSRGDVPWPAVSLTQISRDMLEAAQHEYFTSQNHIHTRAYRSRSCLALVKK